MQRDATQDCGNVKGSTIISEPADIARAGRRLDLQAFIVKLLAIPHTWIGFLFRHRPVTFLLMGVFFLLFGFCSVNLFVVLKANIDLFIQYGPMVIEDGALQQLVEILGSTYLSMMFYIGFRLCERVLVERLVRAPLREANERLAGPR